MAKLSGLLGRSNGSARKDTSIIDFIVGIVLTLLGLYFILKNTSIGVCWLSTLFGTGLPSGIITLPILLGIVILFLKHSSVIGWGCVIVGIVIMLIQIILSLKIVFNTTSLLDYFLMFGGTFGGMALLLRAFLR